MNCILHNLRLPDIVTLINAVCGIVAILLVQNGFTYLAPLLILIAAVADGIDGHIARKFSSSEMGSNLDSLADVISFGVAPVIIIQAFTSDRTGYFLLPLLLFYFICGILRLARFNTLHTGMDSFRGLPITAGGIAMCSYLLTGEGFFNIVIMAGMALILGMLMISDITYIKARNRNTLVALIIIFALTIVSYAVNINYTHIMATLLSGIMLIYVASPIFKRTI